MSKKSEKTQDVIKPDDWRGQWRWWKKDPEKLTKLQEAYLADATDEMACVYAGITPKQLYYYQKLHPMFSEWKKLLKNNPTVQAKLNVIGAIQRGDIQQSNWWLERRARNEFGTVNQNVNVNLSPEDLLSDEEKERLNTLLGNGGSPGTAASDS